MICKNCEGVISLESKFCRYCGNEIVKDSVLKSQIIDSESSTSSKNILVIVFALITCLLTASIVVVLERTIEFSIHSFMLWGFIPVGAVFVGLAASSGYYLGLKYLNLKHNRNVLVGSLLISIFAFFLINYLSFYFMEVDGKVVHDYIGFAEYMDIALTKTHYQLTSRYQVNGQDLGEVGSWGYLIGLLQLGGFAVGGLACFLMIKSEIYCDDCRLYYKQKGVLEKYFSDANEAATAYANTLSLFQANQVKEAFLVYQEKVKPIKDDFLASVINVKECPNCRKIHIEHWMSKLVNNEWKELSKTKYNFTTNKI